MSTPTKKAKSALTPAARAECHARVQEKLAFLKWLTISHRGHVEMTGVIGDQIKAVSRDIENLRRVANTQ